MTGGRGNHETHERHEKGDLRLATGDLRGGTFFLERLDERRLR
jgi:hypothetical protein